MQALQSQRKRTHRPSSRPSAPIVALRTLPRVQAKTACACGGSCPSCRDTVRPPMNDAVLMRQPIEEEEEEMLQAKPIGDVVQAKLEIGAPDDIYEREADAVADRVMRMPDPFTAPSPFRSEGTSGNSHHGTTLQLKGNTGSPSTPSPDTSRAAEAASRRGSPMPPELRAFFEPRFGYDFGQVRLHHDSEAASAAQSVRARAYTLGSDIVFNANQYAPHTTAGRLLLAHELAHVLQQSGSGGTLNLSPLPARSAIQRADDATFESGSGVDRGIAAGTLVTAPIDGHSYRASCGLAGSYSMRFRFAKAYKGTYPYQAGGRDVRGVYVKIEASIEDRRYCGRCTPMRLLQVLRNITRGSGGGMESADPGSATRRERSGWGDADAPSRGWRVDTLSSATNPYYTHNSPFDSEEGSETSPARLWDAPGDWSTDRNAGKEFQTCAVCEDASHRKWVAGCVTWGYYTNSSGDIDFRPTSPSAACGHSQVVRDASERWDTITGNTATGISFGA